MTGGSTRDRVVVGRVVGVFGIKGWVKVKSFTEPDGNILSYSPWVLVGRNGERQEVVCDDATARPQGLIVHLKGYDDRDLAAKLSGMQIEVEAEALPQLGQNDFYWRDLIGLTVVTAIGSETVSLGKVSGMMETGANDVLVVRPDKNVPVHAAVEPRERLIPYVPGVYVNDVNLDEGTIEVDWDPEF